MKEFLMLDNTLMKYSIHFVNLALAQEGFGYFMRDGGTPYTHETIRAIHGVTGEINWRIYLLERVCGP
jgi:hypothetical protein